MFLLACGFRCRSSHRPSTKSGRSSIMALRTKCSLIFVMVYIAQGGKSYRLHCLPVCYSMSARVILLGLLKSSTICHECFSLRIFALYSRYCQFDSRVAVVFLRAEDVWSPPNMALNKPTAQSSTLIYHYVPLSAGYAVDGIQHRTLTTNRPCAHTDGGTYPWWVVDLGQSSLVSEVWIVSRIDGKFIMAYSIIFPLSQREVESR